MKRINLFRLSQVKAFIVLICTSVVWSCTSSDKTINWDKIESSLVAEPVATNTPFLEGIHRPVVYQDYVISRLYSSKYCFSLSQFRNDSLVHIGDFLSIGQGPMEMTWPFIMHNSSSKKFVIYDNFRGLDKVFYIDAKNIQNLFDPLKWRCTNNHNIIEFETIIPFGDRIFLGMNRIRGNNVSSQMYALIDTMRVMDLNFSYPEDESGITKPRLKSFAYKGRLKKHPQDNRFVYFSEQNRYMKIFDYVSNSLRLVSIPLPDYPHYSVKEDGVNISRDRADYLGCIEIAVTEKYIYILMNDATYQDLREEKLVNNHPWDYSNTVYVFDWEGKPIKKCILDHFVYSVFIDADEKYIYGVTERIYEDRTTILRYKL